MRLPSIASVLCLTAACSSTPRPAAEVASEYAAIYEAWDEARLLALFPADQPPNAKGTRKHFAWLHEQLGACGEPQPMWSDKDGDRWTHACERGNLETRFRLDATGHIADLSVGAAEVPPPPELLAAAEAVLDSLPWTLGSERPFKHNLGTVPALTLGRCTLVRPWAFGPRQGLFHARCDNAEARVFAIELGRHGTLSRAMVMSPTLYKGPPIEPPA